MNCKFPEPCWFETHVQHVTKNMTTPIYLDSTSRFDSITPIKSQHFEKLGSIVGGSLAGGAYMLSYPVVWLDGPLPIIDLSWSIGMYKATTGGMEIGSTIGQILDNL